MGYQITHQGGTSSFLHPFGLSSSSGETSSFLHPFDTSSTTETGATNTNSSFESYETLATSHSSHLDTQWIYEDLPGLRPLIERIAELQTEISERVEELVTNQREGVPEDLVTAIPEKLRADSNDVDFMQNVLDGLNRAGAADSDFQNAFQKVLGQMDPAIPSPLEQFSILPLIPIRLFRSTTTLHRSDSEAKPYKGEQPL